MNTEQKQNDKKNHTITTLNESLTNFDNSSVDHIKIDINNNTTGERLINSCEIVVLVYQL